MSDNIGMFALQPVGFPDNPRKIGDRVVVSLNLHTANILLVI